MKHLLIALIILLSMPTFGQKKKRTSWRQDLKVGDELYDKANYADAAVHFESAFRKKTKKKEIIAKAADCYYIIRDYKKAASSYRHIKDMPKQFPLGRLRYARSLKQSGKFDEASREFVYFIENYIGEDKGVLNEVVQGEIRGCEEAIKIMASPHNDQIDIFHLSTRVNSPETEFAPIPFNENVLYYSSNMAEKARIYLTTRNEDGTWRKAVLPKSFPSIPNQHFCNGSLAPDGQRFYFTICDSKENWGGLTTTCEIFVIKKDGDGWSEPQKLHNYINEEGSTSTQPHIVHSYNKEFLYFSSNRNGGLGGMDLWYATRSLDSPDIDFSIPINLGNKINTLGDEITPFYDSENGELYFSSNGQPSMGGQDIFIALGEKTTWTTPENLALPYNSTADDYYYTKTPNINRGFFVSNRVFGVEKIRTTHEDIFEFVVKGDIPLTNTTAPLSRNAPTKNVAEKQEIIEKQIEESTQIVESQPTEVIEEVVVITQVEEKITFPTDISDETNISTVKENDLNIGKAITTSNPSPRLANNDVLIGGKIADFDNTPVNKVLLSVYEILGSNGKRLIENKYFENGEYEFSLPPNGEYIIQVKRDGYLKNEIGISTSSQTTINQDILVEKIIAEASKEITTPPERNISEEYTSELITSTEEIAESEPNTANTISNSSKTYDGSTYVVRGISKRDDLEYSTRAPRHGGVYYKIQLIADKTFSPSAKKFTKLQHLGRYDTEFLSEKGLYRVLLADYFSLENAKETLQTVKENGFKRAFIVKYIDGERLGMFYR